MSYDHLVKLVLIGDSACGKSSLLLRFVDDTFNHNFITTIGIDFKVKMVSIYGKKVKIQVWDTAGQERFRSITYSYYRGASGIIIMYDISNKHSFENVEHWIASIDRYGHDKIPKILVGAKSDLEPSRQVTIQEGKNLASKYDMHFYEVSAKNNVGVNEMFEEFTEDIIKLGPRSPQAFKTKLFPCQPDDGQSEKDKRCCN